MNRSLLNRRRFLRAVGASAATYPFIRGLPGYAALGDAPTYLVLLFTPCGVVPHLWGAECPKPTSPAAPVVAGPLVFRETLAALEPLKNKTIVLDGLNVRAAEGSHEAGMGALWTGISTGNDGLGPSIDQLISKRLNAARPFGSIELMVRSPEDWTGREVKTRMIYTEASAYSDPFDDPVTARNAFFPGASSSSGGAPVDKRTFIRRKLFENLNTELGSLAGRLCAEDRAKLEATQQAWNDLDSQLLRAAKSAESCQAPALAPLGYQAPSADFPTSSKLQMDILALALACDLTRVASIQFSTATSQVTHSWLGADQVKSHHDYSHEGPFSVSELGADPYAPDNARFYASLPQLSAIERWYAEQVRYLASALDQFSVGGTQTLLDRSVICWSSEIQVGAAHNHSSTPFVLVGGGGGRLKTNQAVRFPVASEVDPSTRNVVDRAHNDLLITLAAVMGVKLDSFGSREFCTGPISEILT